MKPSLVASNFINKYTEILDKSVEDFLGLLYLERIQNRYAQEIVAMLNDAGIETADYQWKLFIEKLDSILAVLYNQYEQKLDNILNQMFNWFGLSYADIKFWILDDPDYSKEWEENDEGEIVRI